MIRKKKISDFENWKLIILNEKIFDGMEFSRNIIIIHNILYIMVNINSYRLKNPLNGELKLIF